MASYPHPQARPRKPKRVSTVVRDSNLVRASVLDAALELGVAHNSTMANWIFNSPVEEEAEEPEPEVEETGIPELTSGSAGTSEESGPLYSPQHSTGPTHHSVLHSPSTESPSAPFIHINDVVPKVPQPPISPLVSGVSLQEPRTVPRHSLEGSTSVSLSNNRKQSNDRSSHGSTGKVGSSSVKSRKSNGTGETEYESDGNYLSEGTGLSKKAKKKRKDKDGKRSGANTDGETDGDRDYISDGGYISTSSKSSKTKTRSKAAAFFRRRLKIKSQQGSDDEDDETKIPPVPPVPSRGLLSPPLSSTLGSTPSSPRSKGSTSSAPSTPHRDKKSTDSRNIASPTKSALSPSKRDFQPLTLSYTPSSDSIDLTAPAPNQTERLDFVSPPASLPHLRPSKATDLFPRPLPSPAPSSTTSYVFVSPPPSRPTTNYDSTSTPTTPVISSSMPISMNASSRKLLSPPSKRMSPLASPRLHSSIPPPAPPPNQPLPQVPPPLPSPQRSSAPRRALPKLPNLPAVQDRTPPSTELRSAPVYSLPPSPMPVTRGRELPFPPRPLFGRADSESQVPRSPDMQRIPGVGRRNVRLDTNEGSKRYLGDPSEGGMSQTLDAERQNIRPGVMASDGLRRQHSDQAIGSRDMARMDMAIRGPREIAQQQQQQQRVNHAPPQTPPSPHSAIRPSPSKFHEHLSSVSSIPLVQHPLATSPPTSNSTSASSDRQSYGSSLRSSGRGFGHLSKSFDDDGEADVEDDDESFYPSDEKTAGRKTMYFVENGGHPDFDDFDFALAHEAVDQRTTSHYGAQKPRPNFF